ncbi:MAG: ribbon-helix-helix protein, CopG family [Chloroflexi bacterium]|nr:ribbon-helix-helix protein, CopG family [Chloroflexota bacterium]
MATIKMTFSLDAATSRSLREAAESLGKPKSEVVREAILDYAERVGRLTEAERRRQLSVFDEMMAARSTGSARTVDRELAAVRRARRGGGRVSAPSDPR